MANCPNCMTKCTNCGNHVPEAFITEKGCVYCEKTRADWEKEEE